MKDLMKPEINRFRDMNPTFLGLPIDPGDGTGGAFIVPSPIDKANMRVVASSGYEWDHGSVSRKNRCPNWYEMDFVKRLFFEDHEVAMQLHVPPTDHINCHETCLHIWRPITQPIPLPPKEFV